MRLIRRRWHDRGVSDEGTPNNPWPGLFDSIAEQYDQSGVPWFGPIARHLLDLVDARPGERFLELGSGRGAMTLPLAAAVGPHGQVDAFDIAPSMVRLLQEDLDRSGVSHVRVAVGDAGDPRPPETTYDGIVGSLMLFFLSDPAAALASWRRWVRPGGRVGISSFPVPSGRFRELVGLVDEYAGEGPSSRGGSPFDSDQGVEDLFTQAGFIDARSTTITQVVPIENGSQWRAWTMGTALRRVWSETDPERHPEIIRRSEEVLARECDDRGRMTIDVPIRYTLATV
jgi:ubiquinone/menaquinone biosynthesis C-methylase UbiE